MSTPRAAGPRRAALLTAALLLVGAGCASSAPVAAPTGPAKRASAARTSASSPVPATQSPSSSTSATSAERAPDCRKVRCIALTFDDGPSPYTKKLLRTLDEHDATATLFVVGANVDAHRSELRTAQAMGVEIANHSLTHKQLDLQSSAVVRHELKETQRRIKKATGVTPTLMRPPYAGRSARTDAICKNLGLAVVTWDVSTVDWENHDAATVRRLAVNGARPGGIVLMHDIHPWTVNAVPGIIKDLRKKGYTLVTVSQILDEPKPGKLYASGLS